MNARDAAICGLILTVTSLEAAALSKQEADLFSRKSRRSSSRGMPPRSRATRRTPVTETELNSWFTYSAKPLLPAGVSDPRITMIGNGKVTGQAVVDLDAIAKKKASGGTFDIWNLVGGKVPVNVAGTLRTKDGIGTLRSRERRRLRPAAAEVVPAGTRQLLLAHAGAPAGREDRRSVRAARVDSADRCRRRPGRDCPVKHAQCSMQNAQRP